MSSSTIAETRPGAPTIAGGARFSVGKGFGGAIGKTLGTDYAVELSWDYQSSAIKSINGTTVSGDYASNIFWLNGYRRFPMANGWTPYIGAGIGFVQEIDLDLSRTGGELQYSRNNSTGVQGILGVQKALSPQWRLMADVKWMRVNNGPNQATTLGSALTTVPKYSPASLNVGLVYQF